MQTAPTTPTVLIREVRAAPKKLRLPKYSGLDGDMPISTWLRAVQTAKRQQLARGSPWDPTDVYFEMVQNLKGEALRWYGTVVESIDPETDSNLARLMRDRYEERRTDPEVVARLQDRRQGIGEPLVEYATSLRAIVADRGIKEEWLIDAFLRGMHNPNSATFVRGRDPATLKEAVEMATHQVGRYGEGYGVGLEEAYAQQSARASIGTNTARRGATTPSATAKREQLTTAANFGTGALGLTKPPRYDIDGRLVSTGVADWARTGVPAGYALVPLGASGRENPSPKTSGSQGQQRSGRAQRQTEAARSGSPEQEDATREQPRAENSSRPGRRGGGGSGRTLKMESRDDRAPLGGYRNSRYGPRQPLATKEERLANYQRYLERQAGTPSRPRSGVCFYCYNPGHYAHECPYKEQDNPPPALRPSTNAGTDGGDVSSENEQRV